MNSAERDIAVAPNPALAIEIRNLTKTYKLYNSKNARVAEIFDPRRRSHHTNFQALENVSIEIPLGATVGILGVNGSGKSTLLQLICGIIEASSGTVQVNGRIAALLELGAGFNPDLSGRENVMINGLILGLSRRAVEQRMPEIETFAGIGDFFDHPVKIYSSGMMMRVAFAMAVHVDPDVLVIDEALAVGDARFQQKCFRKFNGFQEAGKTILLVTHDRFSVPRLCTHGLVLNNGRAVFWGDPKQATEIYGKILTGTDEKFAETNAGYEARLATNDDTLERSATTEDSNREESFLANQRSEDVAPNNPLYNPNEFRSGNGGARIIDFLIADGNKYNPDVITSGTTVKVMVRVLYEQDCEDPNVGLTIQTKEGIIVFATNAIWLKHKLAPSKHGDVRIYKFSVRMDLGSHDWFISFAVANGMTDMLDQREAMCHVRCEATKASYGLASMPITIEEHEA